MTLSDHARLGFPPSTAAWAHLRTPSPGSNPRGPGAPDGQQSALIAFAKLRVKARFHCYLSRDFQCQTLVPRFLESRVFSCKSWTRLHDHFKCYSFWQYTMTILHTKGNTLNSASLSVYNHYHQASNLIVFHWCDNFKWLKTIEFKGKAIDGYHLKSKNKPFLRIVTTKNIFS